MQTALLILMLLFFTVVCCFYFSRRFISPILKSLDKIKSEKRDGETSPIAEIDDLFAFLAEQDREYERTLAALAGRNRRRKTKKSGFRMRLTGHRNNMNPPRPKFPGSPTPESRRSTPPTTSSSSTGSAL